MPCATHTRLKTFEGCPESGRRKYLVWPRPPYVPSKAAAIGIAAEKMVQAVLERRFAEGPLKRSTALAIIQGCRNDVKQHEGFDSSEADVEAAWLVEGAFRGVSDLAKLAADGTDRTFQHSLYFDARWGYRDPFEPKGKFVSESIYGGDLDFSWLLDGVPHFVDFKSGHPHYIDGDQLDYYAVLLAKKTGARKVVGGPMVLRDGGRLDLREYDSPALTKIEQAVVRRAKWLSGLKTFAKTPGQPQCRFCISPCEVKAT